MDEALRSELVAYVKRKFRGYPNVVHLAEDIVQEGFLRLMASRTYSPDKENFGYLSVVCLRLGYRQFMAQSRDRERLCTNPADSVLVSEEDVLAELLRAEDTLAILQSLETLREIERIVVTQRYYGDFSFARIAEANGLKLSTTLSHHRRALEKLRPTLTRLLGYGSEEPDE